MSTADFGLEQTEDQAQSSVGLELFINEEPPAPTNLSVTATDANSVSLDWDGDGLADEYEIYRATSSGSSTGDYTLAATVSSTPHTDGSLTNGRQYHYRVRAVNQAGVSDLSGEATGTTDLPAPSFSIDASVQRQITIDWTFNDDNPDGDLTVTESSSGTITTTTSRDGAYTHGSLLDGEQYSYSIERDTGDATASAGPKSAVTILPAVENLTVDTIDGRYVTLSWTESSNNSSGYRLLLQKPSDGSYSQDGGDYAPVAEGETKTATTTELLDGQQYDAIVEIYTDHATARTGTTTFTTDLPGADTLDLDGSEPDQITAQWTQVLNNGEYRIEVRESDANENWGDSGAATVAYDSTLEHTFTGILDGEKFDVRIRTQTQYVDGSWLEGEEITNLPAPSGIGFVNVGTTSLEVQWTDNATFEGSYQVFRKRVDYDGNVTDDRNLRATEAQSAESHADSEVQPGREYEYVVRARTSWVHADTSIGTVSTDSISLSDRAVSPRGWHLEVDHPSGTTLTPDPLDGATRRPTINGFPRVEIPVPYRDRWHSADRDDAPLRVWHSGSREPIETLEHRRLEEGAGSKRTVLEGRGGTQLDRRVIEDVDIEPTHEFAKRLIEEYTDYTATVDDPQTNQEERALDRAESAFEYGQTLQAISDTTPLKITDDGFFECKQTCWSFDAVGNTTATVQSDSFTGGEAAQITDFQDSFSVTFETDYRIEEPEFFHRGIREAYMRMDIYVDGVLATSNLQTAEPGYAPISFAGPLEPGSHTIEFDVQPDGTSDSGDFRLDRFGVRDAQFSYDDSGTLNEPGGHTDGPSPYPDLTRIETVEYTTPLAMTEVSVDAQPTAGSVAELGIRQDGTGDYVTASQTTSHTIQYNDLAATAQARIGLGRRQDLDPRDETPRLGYESQRLDILEISALLDDTPVLTDRSFDRPLIDVLREVADIGNFVFEVRADGDETVIEWTQLGQREVSIDPEIADYSVDRQTEDVVEKAVVYGSAAQITRQTVDVAIGTWVDLPFPDAKIVERKETIYDGDTEFTRGEDYQIRYATEDGQPRIKALSGGALSDGQTVSVDAEVKPRGSYTEGDAGENPKTVIEDIPGLASKQMCDQYALYAVERTGDAIVDASVTISSEEVGALLVDAIDIDRLPGDVPWEVDDISYGDGEVSIELGNGPSADDFLQGLSDRLQRNSERV